MSDAITKQLAKLFNLPKNCVRATLTLEHNALPLLQTECHVLELGETVVSSFELRPVEPSASETTFDLDRMVTEACARMAVFIDRLSQKHSNCIRIGVMLRAQQPRAQT